MDGRDRPGETSDSHRSDGLDNPVNDALILEEILSETFTGAVACAHGARLPAAARSLPAS